MAPFPERPWYQQSPIKIRPDSTYYAPELAPLAFDYPTVLGTLDGQNFIVDRGSGASVQFDGMTCPLQRVHFHAPSEHVVAGERADLEVHLVHEIPQYPEAYASAYLVVAVLLSVGPATARAGASALPLGEWLQRRLSARPGAPQPANPGDNPMPRPPADPLSLPLPDFLPVDLAYYRYEGSLTTAPFDELVTWIVLRERAALDDERTLKIELSTLLGMRLVQPLDRRYVLRSFDALPPT
jgi:carbonic anhydrase